MSHQEIPTDIEAFRKTLAGALRAVGHEGLAIILDDVGLEANYVSPLYEAWDFITSEERLAAAESPRAFWHEWGDVIFDALMDTEMEYRNPMNFGPGHRALAFDAAVVLREVQAALVEGRDARRLIGAAESAPRSTRKETPDVV
jgi:capsid protein